MSNDTTVVGVKVPAASIAKSNSKTAKKDKSGSLLPKDLNYPSIIPSALPYDYVQNDQTSKMIVPTDKCSDVVNRKDIFNWISFVSAGVTMGLLGLVATRDDIALDVMKNVYNAAGVSGAMFTVSFALVQSLENKADHMLKNSPERKISSSLAEPEVISNVIPTPEPTIAPVFPPQI